MAKESMKAREVKRAAMVAKYAAKREQLKTEGDTKHYRQFQKTHHPYVCTTVAKSRAVLTDICVSSAFAALRSANWHTKARFLAFVKQVGSYSIDGGRF